MLRSTMRIATSRSFYFFASLMLFEQPAQTPEAVANPGEPQGLPETRLIAGDHRQTAVRLQPIYNLECTKIATGDENAVGLFRRDGNFPREAISGIGLEIAHVDAALEAEPSDAGDLKAGKAQHIGELLVHRANIGRGDRRPADAERTQRLHDRRQRRRGLDAGRGGDAPDEIGVVSDAAEERGGGAGLKNHLDRGRGELGRRALDLLDHFREALVRYVVDERAGLDQTNAVGQRAPPLFGPGGLGGRRNPSYARASTVHRFSRI